jgi:hypothetical protein
VEEGALNANFIAACRPALLLQAPPLPNKQEPLNEATVSHGCSIYYRSGISILYRYLPAHGGDSPTTAPLTNSRDFSGVSGN